MCNFCHDHLVASFAYHDKLDHICGWSKYVAHPQSGSGRCSPNLWQGLLSAIHSTSHTYLSVVDTLGTIPQSHCYDQTSIDDCVELG